MRVLSIANTFPPGYTGGAEVANYTTSRGLLQRGVDCSILVLNNRISPAVDEFYEFDHLPVHRVFLPRLPRHPRTDLLDSRLYQATLRELRRLKPDLVHIHNVSGATLAPYVACRRAGVPVINTLHDLWLLCPNNMLYRRDGSFCSPARHPQICAACFDHYDYWAALPHRRLLFKGLTRNVRRFVAPSQALIERHVEAGYRRERFRLIPNSFSPRAPEAPRHMGVQQILATRHRYRTLVFAGGGVEIKGARVVAQALPALLRHVEKLRVVVAGGGEARLANQFRHLQPAVEFLGMVPFPEMRALFGAADLTLVPSVCHENSPLTIYESYQAGTPVVGSAFGGIPELIREGETGYLFPVGDGAALAERVVLHFARPSDERRRMRQRCVQHVHQHFSPEQHLDQIQALYQEVLAP